MTSGDEGRDTPRRINASMGKEGEIAGARKDVESVTGNQSRSQKGW
jgi:tetrahydromethanopterin S-methyltransferase subunit E